MSNIICLNDNEYNALQKIITQGKIDWLMISPLEKNMVLIQDTEMNIGLDGILNDLKDAYMDGENFSLSNAEHEAFVVLCEKVFEKTMVER